MILFLSLRLCEKTRKHIFTFWRHLKIHMTIKIRAYAQARKLGPTLTCLFLSSVILWIWIFFLPMMPCSYRDNCWSQSTREVLLKGWERKYSPLPLTSVQRHSDTVIRLRTYARVHFSAQIWQRLLLLTGSKSNEVNAAKLRCGGSQFIPLFNGTAVKNFHAAAGVRMASSLNEKRTNWKVT